VKHIQKWSPICLPIVLIVGIVVGWLVTQQSSITPSQAQTAQEAQGKLPAKLSVSSAPPPEVQKLEELKKAGGPPEKKAPNTREGVLEKLRSSGSVNARPASSEPPPDAKQLEELKKQAGSPAQRQPHTVQELLEQVRSMPGGPEMIEEAKKRGARIGMVKPVEPGTSLSWLNLFRVKEAEAQGTFSLTLSTTNKWSSSSPYGNASFYGAVAGEVVYTFPYVILQPTQFPAIGTQVILPFIFLTFDAPTAGWYIINIDASPTVSSLKHWEGGVYPTVAVWNKGGGFTPVSHPALLELAAGRHYFCWVTTGVAHVYEINIFNF
jgi:hypothetical protein